MSQYLFPTLNWVLRSPTMDPSLYALFDPAFPRIIWLRNLCFMIFRNILWETQWEMMIKEMPVFLQTGISLKVYKKRAHEPSISTCQSMKLAA